MKLPSNGVNGKYTQEELVNIDLEQVKKMIVAQDPKAFDKKGVKRKAVKKKK
jgi:DNA topoisomerase-1